MQHTHKKCNSCGWREWKHSHTKSMFLLISLSLSGWKFMGSFLLLMQAITETRMAWQMKWRVEANRQAKWKNYCALRSTIQLVSVVVVVHFNMNLGAWVCVTGVKLLAIACHSFVSNSTTVWWWPIASESKSDRKWVRWQNTHTHTHLILTPPMHIDCTLNSIFCFDSSTLGPIFFSVQFAFVCGTTLESILADQLVFYCFVYCMRACVRVRAFVYVSSIDRR